ncbi:hypothetical protein [Hyphomicrobium sp. 99]|uniref:hypothetical protein n=1 Tax=Hyphomicrobium sp. 99 TaxID=1163419 RepID=UPI0005F88851|nr:hypothetical protein [Hyphomicrobium sp. 99]
MKFVASVVLPVLALLAAYVSPVFADTPASGPQDPQSAGTTPLPAFIPLSGQEKYASALKSKSGSAAAARQEAEKISALFAGMTTGSISKSDEAEPAERRVEAPLEADPVKPIATEEPSGRSITLASNQSAEDKTGKTQVPPKNAPPADQMKGTSKPHRIPQKAIARETHGGPSLAGGEPGNLAAIGQKVSVIDLLTNPALWWH